MFILSSCPAGMPDLLEVPSWKSFGEFCTDTRLPVAVQQKVGRALDPSAWFLQETFSLFLFSCSVSYHGITYAATENEISLGKALCKYGMRNVVHQMSLQYLSQVIHLYGTTQPVQGKLCFYVYCFHRFPASLVTTMCWEPLKYFFILSNLEKAILPFELKFGLW